MRPAEVLRAGGGVRRAVRHRALDRLVVPVHVLADLLGDLGGAEDGRPVERGRAAAAALRSLKKSLWSRSPYTTTGLTPSHISPTKPPAIAEKCASGRTTSRCRENQPGSSAGRSKRAPGSIPDSYIRWSSLDWTQPCRRIGSTGRWERGLLAVRPPCRWPGSMSGQGGDACRPSREVAMRTISVRSPAAVGGRLWDRDAPRRAPLPTPA